MIINSQLQQDSISAEYKKILGYFVEGICAKKIKVEDVLNFLPHKEASVLIEMVSKEITKKIALAKKRIKEEEEIKLWMDVQTNRNNMHELQGLKAQYIEATLFVAEMKRLEMQSNGHPLPHEPIPETPHMDKKIKEMRQRYLQSQRAYYKSCGKKPQENRKRQPNFFTRLKQMALGAHER